MSGTRAQKNELHHVAPNLVLAENRVLHDVIRKSPEIPMTSALRGFFLRNNFTIQQSQFIILKHIVIIGKEEMLRISS